MKNYALGRYRISKSRRLLLCILILTLIVGSNFISGYINVFTGEGIGKAYSFTTRNNAFTFDEIPTKGKDISMMERQFQTFLSKNPGTADTVLYRTFKPNLLKFWSWITYVTHERYRYEYKRTERN